MRQLWTEAAYHEAGHVILGLLTQRLVLRASLRRRRTPYGIVYGRTDYIEHPTEHLKTKARQALRIALAGVIAVYGWMYPTHRHVPLGWLLLRLDRGKDGREVWDSARRVSPYYMIGALVAEADFVWNILQSLSVWKRVERVAELLLQHRIIEPVRMGMYHSEYWRSCSPALKGLRPEQPGRIPRSARSE